MDVEVIDIVLIPLSFLYIFAMILISSRLKSSEKITGVEARKLVHIAVGGLVIFAPLLFSSNIVPTFIGLCFIVITYITSPSSIIERTKISAFAEGHGLGTVYYSISLTFLLYQYFDEGWIIQVGFLPLVFGDAIANLIGVKYGKHKWRFHPSKSIEGSFSGGLVTFLVLIVVLQFYKIIEEIPLNNSEIIYLTSIISGATVIIELISPKGIDNLTIPIICTIIAVQFS